MRDWARRRTGLDCNFRICFYPGRYAAEKGGFSGEGTGGGRGGSMSKRPVSRC